MDITVTQIDNIKEILARLPENSLAEVRDFAAYLLDRERRRKALEERVLKAEKEHDSVICNSAEEAMQAILNEPESDEA